MHVELMHVRALNSMSSVQHCGNSTSVTKHDMLSDPLWSSAVEIVLAVIAQRQNNTLSFAPVANGQVRANIKATVAPFRRQSELFPPHTLTFCKLRSMGCVTLVSELSWRPPYNLDCVTARGVYAILNTVTPYVQRPSRAGFLQASASQQD